MERVIITGGSEGLGLELSKQFLAKGFEVICISRNKPNLEVVHLPTDFTDKKSIETTIESIKANYREFSTLICSAGIGYIEKMEEIDYEHTEKMFEVNLIGQSFFISGLMNEIKINSSDLIFIGATIAYKGNEFMPMYSVSKWGTRGLVENCRLALKSSSCRVIMISPGGLNTSSNIGPEGRETKIAELYGKEIGTMLDTGKVAKFVYSLIKLPKNMEVSEVIINRN